MAADNSVQTAFDALNSDINRRVADAKAPLQTTAEQRTLLVAYAEANVGTAAVPTKDANRQALGRVQAIYVAGSLSMLDGAGGKNPFADQELKNEYDKQQRFMSNSRDKSRDQEPSR